MTEVLTNALSLLMEWHVGGKVIASDEADGAKTVVFESTSNVGEAAESGLIGAHSLSFVPSGLDTSDLPGQFVVYEGPILTPNTEISIGEDFYLYCQDYSTSEYLSLIGPTIIGIFHEGDFNAFLADADRAITEGVLPEFLRSPAVRLANLPALQRGSQSGPSERLYIAADGAVSTSTTGAMLGNVSDGMSHVEQSWWRKNTAPDLGCAVSLRKIVPEDLRKEAVAQRPWLSRYLQLGDATRQLGARGIVATNVSGFGSRVNENIEASPGVLTQRELNRPLLLWNDSTAFLHDASTQRVFQFNRDAVGAVEAVLVTESLQEAAAFVSAADVERAALQLEEFGLYERFDGNAEVGV